MKTKSLNKSFHSEYEGQIKFFDDLKISADVELTHNTDGVAILALVKYIKS